jgi:hypothetical protein
MTTRIFRGDAPAVAQVTALVISGTIAIGDTFTVSLNGKTVTATATDTTAVTTCGLLAAAWTALDPTVFPEFAEIIATNPSGENTVYLTASTPGIPFGPITLSEVSTSGTFAQSSITTSSGPNDWSVAVNWSPTGVPASSDNIYITDTAVDILYGLSQSSVTLTSLNIDSTYTGTIGLPLTNDQDSAPYSEYRTEYLTIGATTVNIGAGNGSGSGRIKIDEGSVSCTVNISGTASADDPVGAVQLLTDSTAAVVNVFGGTVAIGMNPGETAVLGTLNIVPSGQNASVTVNCGSGVTINSAANVTGGTFNSLTSIPTLTMSGGTCDVEAVTTVKMSSGTLALTGSVTTMSLDGGTTTYTGTGTITTANIGAQASLLFNADINSRTVTNCNLYAGATLNDSNRTVTWTNPIQLNRCAIADCKINLGDNIKLAPTYF